MKTMNNVQKASLRTAAVIASFILISYTVNAQNFWKEFLVNNSFGVIAEALTDNSIKHNSVKVESIKATTRSFSESRNKKSENNFDESDNLKRLLWNCYMEEVNGNNPEIENWTLNESNFSGKSVNLKAESEKPLELEN